MVSGNDNKQVSTKLNIPISTIQRRVKKIRKNQFVIQRVNINYEKYGYKTGLLHVYLSNDEMESIANKISD